MKAGYEMVHGSLDTIQTLESWNSCPMAVGLPTPAASATITPFPKESRCANLNRNELSEWVEHITRQLIDDDDLPESSAPDAQAFPRPTATTSSRDDNNSIPDHGSISEGRPKKMMRMGSCGKMEEEENERSLRLISVLLESAVAISVDNLGEAHGMLLELTQLASPYAECCGERVVAYFARAMCSRLINSWLGISSSLAHTDSMAKTFHSSFNHFNNLSPFVKFAHFTSNQAILEAFHRRDRVHIIDLDIMQGLQWPALFHILATRLEGPPHVRLTALGPSPDLLLHTGNHLSSFASRLGIPFEFHSIPSNFRRLPHVSEFRVRRGEALAVHWLHHSLYDSTGPDCSTMSLIQALSPTVFTLVEQDVSRIGSFLDRFVGCLHYYSTLFDSLAEGEDAARHCVEHGLLYREIHNVLAIGGPSRTGADKFRQWRSEMGKRMLQVPMSPSSMAQAQLILNSFPPAHGYTLLNSDGFLSLGWKQTSLYTASAWTSPHFPTSS